MNTIKPHELWSHVQSLFTRQRYRGVPDDNREDHNEILTFQSQPSTSTFSLASFSSALPKSKNPVITSQPVDEHRSFLQSDDEPPTSEAVGHERWITGVKHCARVGVIFIALNVVFISIAAGLASRISGNSGFGLMATLWHGNCGTSKIWDICLHLGINALSTSILGASNYCMQTLVAPTREDVDRAHANGKWLDIGSASIKNLLAIGKDRLALWIVLMITTTPFHLMYNSILFESLSTNEFGTVVGPKDLNSSNIWDLETPYIEQCFSCPGNISGYEKYPSLRWSAFAHEIANNNYERHPFSSCNLNTHTGYKGIVMLAENLTVADGGNRALLLTDNSYTAFRDNSVWATPFFNATATGGNATAHCESVNYIEDIYIDIEYDSGLVGAALHDPLAYASKYPVKECLIIKAEEHCELLYSPVICVVIMLTACVKVTAMYLAARVNKSRPPPLLTVGDAIASFMARPDPTTKNQCWMSGRQVRKGHWNSKTDSYDEVNYRYLGKRKRWFRAATPFRWAITLLMVWGAFFAAVGLLVQAIYGMPDGVSQFLAPSQFTSLFSADVEENDYGQVGGLYDEDASMLNYVVIANMPQLIVTMCYYCYNAVLTSMLAEAEYNSHAIKRKPLRVTWPVKGSEQRSTYYLSVPYRYGAPVLVLYTILHWTISQAIFYLWLIPYTPMNTRDTGSISAIGFSSSFVFFAVLTGLIMAVLPCVLAFRRYKSNIPLAGSCSAAISAACHPPPDEDLNTAALGKVRWGQVIAWSEEFSNSLEPSESDNTHCSFTSLETVNPTLTKMYA